MGITNSKSLWAQSAFIPKPKYTEKDVPDLKGKTVIVTGANTGIGLETARVLLAKHARVYVAARSAEKAHTAIDGLKKTQPDADVHFLELDLADLKKAKAAAKAFMAKEDRLDILFNSAGVMIPPSGSKTADGYELQWGTNVLGHFAFTTALLPVLVKTATAEKASGGFVRVINTSSTAHMFAPKQGIVFENINLDGKSSTDKYSQSKLGNVYFANELARRYKDQGILSVSLNPGNIKTDLQRNTPSVLTVLFGWMLYPVKLGAITQIYAGTSPSVTLVADSGAYFVPWARKSATNHPKAQDEGIAKKVWEWCEAEVEKVTGEPAVALASS